MGVLQEAITLLGLLFYKLEKHQKKDFLNWLLGKNPGGFQADTGIRDRYPGVRQAAATTLSLLFDGLPDTEADPQKTYFLNWLLGKDEKGLKADTGIYDEDPNVRQEAIKTLGSLFDSLAETQIRDLLDWLLGWDEKDQTTTGIRDEDSDVGPPAAVTLVTLFDSLADSQKTEILNWLLGRGEEGNRIWTGIRDGNLFVRENAITTLGSLLGALADPQKRDLLNWLLGQDADGNLARTGIQDWGWPVKGAAATTLGSLFVDLKNTQKIEVINLLLGRVTKGDQDPPGIRDANPFVRGAAASTLGSLYDELADSQKTEFLNWLLGRNADGNPDDFGIQDIAQEVREAAFPVYRELRSSDFQKKAQQFIAHFSQSPDAEQEQGTSVQSDLTWEKSEDQLRIGEAVIDLSPWGDPSPNTPDIALVNSHEEINSIKAERDSANRSPPLFAVATRPFLKMMETLLFAVKHNLPVLIESETGFGKSLAGRALASLIGIEADAINLHGGMLEEDLIGSLEPDDSGKLILVFKDGPLVDSMENDRWMILEEVNMGSTAVLERLNYYLSHKRLYVRRNGKLEKVNVGPRFRLLAFINPKGYGERKPLSRPFLSRFMFWKKHRSKEEMNEHLTGLIAVLSGMERTLSQKLAEFHMDLSEAAEGWRTGAAQREPYKFDQRHLLRMLDRLPDFAGKSMDDLTAEDRTQLALIPSIESSCLPWSFNIIWLSKSFQESIPSRLQA